MTLHHALAGYYTLLAAKMGHEVIAVEPILSNLLRLHKSVILNKLSHLVKVVHNALSDARRNVTMTSNYDNQGGIAIERNVEHAEQDKMDKSSFVQTTTMDHLLELADMQQAIIKLDIGNYFVMNISKVMHLNFL